MKLTKINGLPSQGVSHNAKIKKRVMVANGAVKNLVNHARAIFPPGEKTGSHRHEDMTEIFTCESGAGEIRVNDVGYVFSSGTTVVVEPGEVHEIINTGRADLVVTYMGVLAG
ncbi:Oxalate-binding protein [Pontiella desulfatans]|uniref:Oxalate-binding protein n=1 Tax=Pontiella desulfatans TaxID=2750659 RepID=A0A6C2TWY7_PONDE|nr:cupin domain-containing protein [Pontiella desulfatans]VGO12195.1 Oxalate-binding protein [Pontiella desulfatans]